MKLRMLTLPLFVLFFSSLPLAQVRVQTTVRPGQSVGHVFLGMDRADVWKILGKPKQSYTVPHRMSLYGEDIWTGNGHKLEVVSEQDRVIQVEFNSPHMTIGGLSSPSTLNQLRRRYPVLTVHGYGMYYNAGNDQYLFDGNIYYLDNTHAGIAFTFFSAETFTSNNLYDGPDTVIIHRPNHPAVPIYDGHWDGPMSTDENPNNLRLMRSWFAPHKGN